MIPRVVLFDLDNTLTASKQPIEEDMADALARLLSATKVAIISGGTLTQLSTQVAQHISSDAGLSNLYLLPTSGAALYHYDAGDADGTWNVVYDEVLTEEERERIRRALEEGASKTGLIDFATEKYGPYIEDRGSQVSLSALGQSAPVDEKKAWDPTHERRTQLQKAIAPLLPGFTVSFGGLTTIDVTKNGINKAFGIRKLSDYLHIPIADMLYVGDELRPGGNDFIVTETGIATKAVTSPNKTLDTINQLLKT